jgi:hypothetical protein
MKQELIERIKKAPQLLRDQIELEVEKMLLRHEQQGGEQGLLQRQQELDAKKQKAEESVNAINTAVKDFAKKQGLDLTDRKNYDHAWARVRDIRPDLFQR